MVGDPIVQRLGTLEELGQESSKCENSRSREQRSESQPLIGRGHMALDLRVQRLGSSGNLRCEELVSYEAQSCEVMGVMDLWIYVDRPRS
jgi:hypothetical protein